MRNLIICLFIGICFQITAFAQEADPVTPAETDEVIDSITSLLNRNYIFPEVAAKMKAFLKENLANDKYAEISDPRMLGTVLTQDLQSISQDKHLRVNFAPSRIADMRQAVTPEDSLAYVERMVKSQQRNNFGFQKIEFLDGNVGYLDLRGFANPEFAGETATAAMNYLANSDALIIDLRQNGGGSPQMIQLITSYLFSSDPVHLNNFYHRPTDEHSQTWTLPHVPGKRFPKTPVYVLTSGRTFSAAEEFSYNLKNLKRATLIGETTGGGAHPGGSRIATDRFMVWIPTGRAINPITNTNWEGTGVEPDIKVEAPEALKIAHEHALQTLWTTAGEEQKDNIRWALDAVQAQNKPVEWDENKMKQVVGQYGPRKISLKDGQLYYSREGNTPEKLIPLSDDHLMLESISWFRIQVIYEDGEVKGLKGVYQDGRSDMTPRTNT